MQESEMIRKAWEHQTKEKSDTVAVLLMVLVMTAIIVGVALCEK